MHDFKNQPIEYLRMTLCYSCPMKCNYCYIDTYKTDVINIEVAKDIISSFLYSKGDKKVLGLIGGETFIYPDILRQIIDFAQSLSSQVSKKLNIYIVTSGIITPIPLLEYLSEKGVKIALSIDGLPSIHDKNRILKNNLGTFDLIRTNKKVFQSYFSKSQIGISMTIEQSVALQLFASFLYLLKKEEMNYCFTIVMVKGIDWNDENEYIFSQQIRKVLNYVLNQIEKRNFVYIYGLISGIRSLQTGKNYFQQTTLNVFPDGLLSQELIMTSKKPIKTNLEEIYSYYAEIIFERSAYNKNYREYILSQDKVLYF